MPDEYDDGFDSRESFEAFEADRPDDVEPQERIELLVRIEPAENGEFMRTAEEVKAELEQFAETMAMGGESLGYNFEVLILKRCD